ncbi:hypothetical protein ACIB24_21840 [Spongisporangium articulatum]|uniref:DUF7802 domain-containing protein n=1 Tax=Spongisporangium articulatum TaxID=3362603 RepID=A0ABW8ATP9_9ACTN
MSGCTPGYVETARALGGLDCSSAWVSVRSPLDPADGTMPVVEALMVVGALLTLAHAVRRWRRLGDPTNLGLWCASVVYVLVLEPPLYFPDRFGLDGEVGLIFVHNVFTVQFLHDRLPLYILALYPALTYLAYALVQRTGLLARHGTLTGAACVAVVFHAFYEVFDMIGPRLHWWAWNPDAPTNTPLLGDVPLSSLAVFAAASPFGVAVLTDRLLARPARGPFAVRVVAVGVLAPVLMTLPALPYGVVSRLPDPSPVAEAVALWAIPAVLLVAAVLTVVADRRAHPVAVAEPDPFPVTAGVVYLVVFAGLWLHAWSRVPIEGRAYAATCFAVCLVVLASGPILAGPRSPQKAQKVGSDPTK